MAKKVHEVSNTNNKTIDAIFIALIAAFMLVVPFYRGLFFRVNYIPAVIAVSALFVAYTVHKLRVRTYKTLDTYMDVSVLLIPAAYLISFFFAVNAKDALDMFLIYCSYFMLYKVTSELSAKDETYKDIFINVIIVSTFILSFVSILNIAGILDIDGSFIGKRLYGLYQYPNTTASVLGVGIILSLNKLINFGNSRAAAIYQMIFTALISSFIFTLSRGGYLVLAGVLLLNFLLVSAKAKLKMLLGLFISFLSSSILIYKFYTLAEDALSGIWIHYIISIIASAVIIYAVYFLKKRINFKFTDKSINIALIAMTLVFAGVAAFILSAKEPIEYRVEHLESEKQSGKNKNISLYELEPDSKYTIEFNVKASVESPRSYGITINSYDAAGKHTEIFKHLESVGSEFSHKSFEFTTLENTQRVVIFLWNYEANSYTVYKDIVIKDTNDIAVKKIEKLKYIPEFIARRLSDISLETQNVSLRVYFMKDGLKIIKDYPITGAGGGAWRNLYRQYQSIPYNSTEVHNFYVQYGTEVGIIGLAALTALLLLFVTSMVKNIKKRSTYMYVYLAVLLMLLHSAIDFNLSLAAVGYMLWMMIGIIASDKNTPIIEKSPQKCIGACALVLSLVIFFVSSSVYYGIKLGNQGAKISNENKNMDMAIALYKKASTFDKYNGAYRIDMAQIMSNQLRKTKEKKYYDGIMEQISLIKKYEPYNHQYTPIICSVYLSTGKLEEASALADQKLRDEPLLIQSYDLKIDVNYEIANYYLKNEKVQEAIPYLERILEVKDKLVELNTNLKEPLELKGNSPKKVEAAQRTLEMIKDEMNK